MIVSKGLSLQIMRLVGILQTPLCLVSHHAAGRVFMLVRGVQGSRLHRHDTGTV